jgi:hypothetical protein
MSLLLLLKELIGLAGEAVGKGAAEESGRGLLGVVQARRKLRHSRQVAERSSEMEKYCTAQNVANLLSCYYAKTSESSLREVQIQIGKEILLTGVYCRSEYLSR